MLELYNVSKYFGTKTLRKVILNQESFRVKLGTASGGLSPNGTGKKT